MCFFLSDPAICKAGVGSRLLCDTCRLAQVLLYNAAAAVGRFSWATSVIEISSSFFGASFSSSENVMPRLSMCTAVSRVCVSCVAGGSKPFFLPALLGFVRERPYPP